MLHKRLVGVFRFWVGSFGVELALGCDLDGHRSERMAPTRDGTPRGYTAAVSTCLLYPQNNHAKDDTLETCLVVVEGTS